MNAYNELIDRVKKVPISRLKDVVDAIDGKLTSSNGFSDREIEEAGRRVDWVGVALGKVGALALPKYPLPTPVHVVELAELERRMLESALRKTGGNQSQAARLVGMERKAFCRRCVKYKVK